MTKAPQSKQDKFKAAQRRDPSNVPPGLYEHRMMQRSRKQARRDERSDARAAEHERRVEVRDRLYEARTKRAREAIEGKKGE